MASFQCIDIPFSQRHTCWFCGEPSHVYASFPRKNSRKRIEHAPLEVPACEECVAISASYDASSVLHLRDGVKHGLLKKYAKALGIGINWTKQELEESEFTGAALEGFRRSAWEMYEIAKARIDYKGWPLSLDGIPMEIYDETSSFEFDGMSFLSLQACIDHYVDALTLDKALLEQLVDVVGCDRFSYALRIARLNPRVSNARRTAIVAEIELQELEQAEANSLLIDDKEQEFEPGEVQAISLSGITAEPDAICWLLNNAVTNLAQLAEREDDFFDDFQHLGGVGAFAKFNGVQLYLDARSDLNWTKHYDLNQELWDKLAK